MTYCISALSNAQPAEIAAGRRSLIDAFAALIYSASGWRINSAIWRL